MTIIKPISAILTNHNWTILVSRARLALATLMLKQHNDILSLAAMRYGVIVRSLGLTLIAIFDQINFKRGKRLLIPITVLVCACLYVGMCVYESMCVCEYLNRFKLRRI